MTMTFATMAANRFGYGRRPGEEPARDVEALLAQVERGVLETCPFPHDGISGRRESFHAFHALEAAHRRAQAEGTVPLAGGRAVNPYASALTTTLLRDQHLKVRHAVISENGFFERLAAFWCDHFSISTAKGLPLRLLAGLYEAEALRPNLAGPFEDLLNAAILHPAMLFYLDQIRSIGPDSRLGRKQGRGLNENLARELIELHTMGAGSGYTQGDVRAAAYVLTGCGYRPRTFEVAFYPDRAEPGVHRVLGRAYGGMRRRMADVTALLSDLSQRPETRRHICRKLAVHFIADDPPAEVVTAMEAAWRASGGMLLAVYRAMLEHPRSREQEGRKARQPFDFVVASLRALGVPAAELDPLPAPGKEKAAMGVSSAGGTGALTAMLAGPPLRANPDSVAALERLGQPLWRAPSPAGWDEDISVWITASQLAGRIAYARRLVGRFGAGRDPRDLLETVMADAARDDTIRAVSRAPSRAAGLTMVLAAPEFNRR